MPQRRKKRSIGPLSHRVHPVRDEVSAASPLRTDGIQKFKRGLITHKALELLPALAEQAGAQAHRAFLARPAHDLDEDVQTSIYGEVMAILTSPVFAAVFSDKSKAEVPITGLIDDSQLVSRTN